MTVIQSILIFLSLAPALGLQTAGRRAAVPVAVHEPQSGTLKYRVALKIAEFEFAGTSTSTVREENGQWIATHELESLAGSTTDLAVLEKRTLHLKRRTLVRGPAEYNIEIHGNKAKGSVRRDGKESPISANLAGPLFASGPGVARAIACLPLVTGYSTTFQSFDIERQTLMSIELKVTGSETVTVPAGQFDTFKVELSSVDQFAQSTIWIAKDSRKPVKMTLFMGRVLTIAELEANGGN